MHTYIAVSYRCVATPCDRRRAQQEVRVSSCSSNAHRKDIPKPPHAAVSSRIYVSVRVLFQARWYITWHYECKLLIEVKCVRVRKKCGEINGLPHHDTNVPRESRLCLTCRFWLVGNYLCFSRVCDDGMCPAARGACAASLRVRVCGVHPSSGIH